MNSDVLLALFGGVVLVLGLLSRLLRRNALSPVLLVLVLGALVGPDALGWVQLTDHLTRTQLLEELARLTLALAVADIGLMITKRDLRANARRLLLLLTVVMAGMWLMTAAGAWLLLGLPVTVALLLAAALTPTDPAVAAGLVTGSLPERVLPRTLRRTLQLESGSNDGLALPLVLIAGLLATQPAGAALSHWVVEAGRELGLAVAVGPLIGWGAGALSRHAERHVLVAASFLPVLGVAASVLTLGLVHLLGGSGILGAFLTGVTMSLVLPDDLREPVGHTLTTAGRVAVVATVGVFGTVLPWSGWGDLGWLGPGFALWVLLLRRPPVVWAALRGGRADPASRAYLAWFGPVGIAGIYYLAVAERYGLPQYEQLYAAGSLVICASIVAHTVTSTPLVRRYGRRAGTAGSDRTPTPGARVDAVTWPSR